jgi:glycosyltransferase involved in cell wall biosynthesis
MRILQVSSAGSFGGGERHLADLINGLTRRGHEVFLAAPADSPLRGKTGLPPENIFPVKVRNTLDISAARQLAALIKNHRIEVAHAHVARDYFPVSLAARFAPDTKLVLTRHVLFPMKTLHRFALANVSRVIAVSSAVQKQLLEERVFAPEKIVTIANGIDTSHWAALSTAASHEDAQVEFRSSHGIPRDALLVGTVGELKKLKGQEDLLLAAEMILQRFPETHFVIVGKDNSGDGEYKSYLQHVVSAIGADGRVTWLDRVEDTAPLLRALDVFVSASHSESFGLAILEAMAAGCAIVATATGGATELLPKDRLVPIEDPLKMAEAVCRLLGDGAERIQNGEAGQKIALEKFGMEKMIDATEKLYLGL